MMIWDSEHLKYSLWISYCYVIEEINKRLYNGLSWLSSWLISDPSIYIVMISLHFETYISNLLWNSAASFFIAAIYIVIADIYHDDRTYESIFSRLLIMNENYYSIFLKLGWYERFIILIHNALINHFIIGCISESDCILIAARRSLIWNGFMMIADLFRSSF